MVSCRAAFCRRSVTSSLWQRRSRNLRATATAGSDTSYKPKSATDAVERGTQLFQEKNYVEALRLYEEAMAMSPNDDEARAAKYNAACVHAQRKEWQEAVTCLKVAVNKYNLKAKVILEDRDLRPLRERREWLDAQDDFPGALFFGFLVARDLKAKTKAEAVVEREDALGRLQVDLGKGRVLPLSRLRGSVRPLVVAGSKGYVNKVLRDAKRYKADLRERGVSLVPVVMSDADPESQIEALKRDPAFNRGGSTGGGKGFSGAAAPNAAVSAASAAPVSDADRKWELKTFDVKEWAQWLDGAMDEKGVSERNIYIQVQLDGSVRASGSGVPPFPKFVGDIPTLDSIRTGFTDGVGPQDD